jgi:hypothetical protein
MRVTEFGVSLHLLHEKLTAQQRHVFLGRRHPLAYHSTWLETSGASVEVGDEDIRDMLQRRGPTRWVLSEVVLDKISDISRDLDGAHISLLFLAQCLCHLWKSSFDQGSQVCVDFSDSLIDGVQPVENFIAAAHE